MGGSLELKTKENIFKRCFGDKEFITYYWRLYTPALFYGIFFAFAPIIISNLFAVVDTNTMAGVYNKEHPVTQGQFINLVYTQGNSLWNSMYFFVVVVIRTGVGPIGNAIGRNNVKETQSMLRLCFWLIVFISLIIMLANCADSSEVLNTLQLVGSQLDKGHSTQVFTNAVTQYVNWSAISVFFYGLGMLYQPMFSTYKKTFPQMFAAFFSFAFILIAAPCYVLGSATPNQSVDQVIARCNVAGILVDAYYFCMIFFFAVFCLCPKMLTIKTTSEKILKNKYYIEQHQRFTEEANVAVKELWKTPTFTICLSPNITNIFNFFRTGFWFSSYDVKSLFYVGWSIFLDQVIWSIANVFLIIFSTNVNAGDWQLYNTAAKPASLLNNYVYSVANSFAILPSAFVAYELGLNNIKKAKENGWKLYYWGTATALILMIIIFIIASFMPGLTVTNPDVIGLSIGLTMIFGVSVLFNSAYQIALNVLFSGGNRWVQLNNALVTIINSFAVIVVINNQIVYNGLWNDPTYTQFYGYYVIGKSYVVVKFIVATILLKFTNWSHNSNELGKGSSFLESLRRNKKKINTALSTVGGAVAIVGAGLVGGTYGSYNNYQSLSTFANDSKAIWKNDKTAYDTVYSEIVSSSSNSTGISLIPSWWNENSPSSTTTTSNLIQYWNKITPVNGDSASILNSYLDQYAYANVTSSDTQQSKDMHTLIVDLSKLDSRYNADQGGVIAGSVLLPVGVIIFIVSLALLLKKKKEKSKTEDIEKKEI